ncbi:LPXTG cell wall anchor domain-containing protein, partial [Escherichia coli]|nr:LPXTG cell wall anchor domain-containing protein [Escherichia coli]
SASLLPSSGDAFSVWPIVIGVVLVALAVYYLLRRKYKKSFESMRYAFKRFFYGRLR